MPKKKRRTRRRTRTYTKREHPLSTLVKIIAVLGCLLLIFISVLQILSAFGFSTWPLYYLGALNAIGFIATAVFLIVFGVINIVIAILLLSGYGFVEWEKKVAANWLILIALGIVTFLLGGFYGSICLIIAGVFDIIGILIR